MHSKHVCRKYVKPGSCHVIWNSFLLTERNCTQMNLFIGENDAKNSFEFLIQIKMADPTRQYFLLFKFCVLFFTAHFYCFFFSHTRHTENWHRNWFEWEKIIYQKTKMKLTIGERTLRLWSTKRDWWRVTAIAVFASRKTQQVAVCVWRCVSASGEGEVRCESPSRIDPL